MAATAKWLDSDTVEITAGTSVVVRKVRECDFEGYPELRERRTTESAPKPQKRRRKANAKADA